MDPIIISDTVQEFNGTRFYKCGAYFQHKGKALHVEVWTQAHGPIPEGFEIHHRDHNRSNNALSNLELLEGSEHARLHSRTPENRRRALEQLPAARERAKEWHGSEAGREWHKEQYQRTADAAGERVGPPVDLRDEPVAPDARRHRADVDERPAERRLKVDGGSLDERGEHARLLRGETVRPEPRHRLGEVGAHRLDGRE